MNRVVHGAEARRLILAGAEELYKAVKVTFGPTSGNVGIMSGYSQPRITHDGVSVAKSLNLKGDDRFGSELIKQTAVKMENVLGDGTTTTTILAYHILAEANERCSIGENPMLLRNKLNEDMSLVLSKLDNFSEKADTQQKLAEVATISSGDPDIGALVAEAVYKTGIDGVVTVEPNTGRETTFELIEGYTFNQGYTSPYFVTNEPHAEAELEKPAVAICARALTDGQDVIDIIEKLHGNKELLIVAPDFSESVMQLLVLNKLKGVLNVVAVKAPDFGDGQLKQLDDMSAVVGGSLFFKEGSKAALGSAERVVVGSEKSTIVGGAGDATERIKTLTDSLKKLTGYELERAKLRLASIRGKVAAIRVGGISEQEVGEKKDRVDDAVFACRAAMEDGTVPGCATTTLLLSRELPEDSLLGYALEQPFYVLLENAGVDPDEWADDITAGVGLNMYDPTKLVDLRKVGIVDPTKTIRKAIEGAVSIAGTAITMKSIVIELPIEKEVKDV